MTYSKQTWADGSAGNTPITADRLDHIEDGIADVETYAAGVTPDWVGDTLKDTLDTLPHPMMLMVVYSSGWTIDPDLQTDANVAWHFVGGTSGTPPPSTTGPKIWDHA